MESIIAPKNILNTAFFDYHSELVPGAKEFGATQDRSS
jgi:hypothetical protein